MHIHYYVFETFTNIYLQHCSMYYLHVCICVIFSSIGWAFCCSIAQEESLLILCPEKINMWQQILLVYSLCGVCVCVWMHAWPCEIEKGTHSLRDPFILLNRLCGTVTRAKLDHQTHSHVLDHLWNLNSSSCPVDCVCVCVCDCWSLFWLCFCSLLCNGLCALISEIAHKRVHYDHYY